MPCSKAIALANGSMYQECNRADQDVAAVALYDLLISFLTCSSVCTASSGNLPLVSGKRFSRRLDFRRLQSRYTPAITSESCVLNPSRQNQLCIGGIGW